MFKKSILFLALLSLSLSAISLDTSTAKAGFKAYKTPEKAAVNGTLDKGVYKLKKKSGTLSELLTGASASFDASNLNLANELKNANLAKFFTALLKDKSIKVYFKSVTEGKKGGTILSRIKINGVNQNIPLQYSIEGNKLQIKGLIDLYAFKADKALASLSKNVPEHFALSWPQVELEFQIDIK